MLDRLEQVALVALAVFTDDGCRLGVGQLGDAPHGLEVELEPAPLIGGVDKAVSVAAIAVHVAVALGQIAVGEQDRDLVRALRAQRPEIPHRRGTTHIVLRAALLRADEVGEFVGVAHEEDRRVVADQVPSSVENFIAKPRTSRSASAAPRSPATVENRQKHSVFLPTSLNSLALV